MRKLFFILALIGFTSTLWAQPLPPTTSFLPKRAVTSSTNVVKKSLTVQAAPTSFRVSWSAVAGAVSYEVRTSTNLFTWTILTNTTSTSVIVPNNEPMRFFDTRALMPSSSSVTVAWNPSPTPNVAGYRVYYGPNHFTYTNVVDSVTTNATIVGLRSGIYYINATTFDHTGLESDYDGEISFLAPYQRVPIMASITLQ